MCVRSEFRGNPNLPDDQTNNPGFLSECRQFRAITECLEINDPAHREIQFWLYNHPHIREEPGRYILLNGCGEPKTCGSSSETIEVQRAWLYFRKSPLNSNDPISLHDYMQRYNVVCGRVTGMSVPDKGKLLEKLRKFENTYNGQSNLSAFTAMTEAAVDNGCCDAFDFNTCMTSVTIYSCKSFNFVDIGIFMVSKLKDVKLKWASSFTSQVRTCKFDIEIASPNIAWVDGSGFAVTPGIAANAAAQAINEAIEETVFYFGQQSAGNPLSIICADVEEHFIGQFNLFFNLYLIGEIIDYHDIYNDIPKPNSPPIGLIGFSPEYNFIAPTTKVADFSIFGLAKDDCTN